MTLREYVDLFEQYYGLTKSEREEVAHVAILDRDAARECFEAMAREILADPRHKVNERLRIRKEVKSEDQGSLFGAAA